MWTILRHSDLLVPLVPLTVMSDGATGPMHNPGDPRVVSRHQYSLTPRRLTPWTTLIDEHQAKLASGRPPCDGHVFRFRVGACNRHDNERHVYTTCVL